MNVMTPYQQELLDNIRRTAERGLARSVPLGYDFGDPGAVDIFQHILDEVRRLQASSTRVSDEGNQT